jgi:hypothetical protein
MKEALLNNQPTSDDLLAKVLPESVNGAIGIPGDIGEQFERMTADRITEEFFFGAKALEPVGFDQWDGGEAVEVAGREEPRLEIGD